MSADDASWILAAFALYGIALSIAYWLRKRARTITINTSSTASYKPGDEVQIADSFARIVSMTPTTLTVERIGKVTQ